MEILKKAINRICHSEPSFRERAVALEQEFAGVKPITLVQLPYRETPGQQAPSVNLAQRAVEVVHVPTITKVPGEEIKAHLVYFPSSGASVVIEIANTQQTEEIEPGKPLRFIIPEKHKNGVFTTGGRGSIYAKGAEATHRWVLSFEVPWGVKPELMRQDLR